MYLILTFGVVTQIVFDTCLLTDVEEHYTKNNKESVIVVALNKLNINPCKKNKRRITFIVTFLTLITIYFIVRCRKTGSLIFTGTVNQNFTGITTTVGNKNVNLGVDFKNGLAGP